MSNKVSFHLVASLVEMTKKLVRKSHFNLPNAWSHLWPFSFPSYQLNGPTQPSLKYQFSTYSIILASLSSPNLSFNTHFQLIYNILVKEQIYQILWKDYWPGFHILFYKHFPMLALERKSFFLSRDSMEFRKDNQVSNQETQFLNLYLFHLLAEWPFIYSFIQKNICWAYSVLGTGDRVMSKAKFLLSWNLYSSGERPPRNKMSKYVHVILNVDKCYGEKQRWKGG